jgi:hypothetical protein
VASGSEGRRECGRHRFPFHVVSSSLVGIGSNPASCSQSRLARAVFREAAPNEITFFTDGSIFLISQAEAISGNIHVDEPLMWVENKQASSDAGLFGCHSRGRGAEAQTAINRAHLIFSGECLK